MSIELMKYSHIKAVSAETNKWWKIRKGKMLEKTCLLHHPERTKTVTMKQTRAQSFCHDGIDQKQNTIINKRMVQSSVLCLTWFGRPRSQAKLTKLWNPWWKKQTRTRSEQRGRGGGGRRLWLLGRLLLAMMSEQLRMKGQCQSLRQRQFSKGHSYWQFQRAA